MFLPLCVTRVSWSIFANLSKRICSTNPLSFNIFRGFAVRRDVAPSRLRTGNRSRGKKVANEGFLLFSASGNEVNRVEESRKTKCSHAA